MSATSEATMVVPPAEAEAVRRTLTQIAAPGTWLTGAERTEVAHAARRALAGGPPATDTLGRAAAMIAKEPASIRSAWIEALEVAGLDRVTHVEVLSIVARLVAVDTVTFALDGSIWPLHDPVEGRPSRDHREDIAVEAGWLPTVGPAHALTALTAVQAEWDEWETLHGDLYLTFAQMGEIDIVRDGLHRTQIELVAARASRINDCFF